MSVYEKINKKIKGFFVKNSDLIIFIINIMIIPSLYTLYYFDILTYNIDANKSSIIGTMLQSLASISAIVFSISLMAIQMCSENLSHRVIYYYVRDSKFYIPALITLIALIIDYYYLYNLNFNYLQISCIVFNISAILTLFSFFIYTVMYLNPVYVIHNILNKIKNNNIVRNDYSTSELYTSYFQPIEDIIKKCILNQDNATVQNCISLIYLKMREIIIFYTTISELPLDKSSEYLGKPFAKLLSNLLTSSNNNNAIEITQNIISIIRSYINILPNNNFLSTFILFDMVFDDILRKISFRFDDEEYALERAVIELEIANARTSIVWMY